MEKWLPLVYKLAKQYGAKYPVQDSEQYSDGCLALAKYVKPGNKISYVYRCVRGMILRGIAQRRKQSMIGQTLRGKDSAKVIANTPFNYGDLPNLACWDDEVAKLPKLNKKQQKLVDLYLTPGITDEEICKEMGMTMRLIKYMIKRIAEKMDQSDDTMSPGVSRRTIRSIKGRKKCPD